MMSASDLPSYQELMLPILTLIGTNHPTINDCLPKLQQQFGLSDDQMNLLLPSGKQPYVANRAHWARNYLKHAGLVQAVRRGHYIITDDGRALLAKNPRRIDNKLLVLIPAFAAWIKGGPGDAAAPEPSGAPVVQGALDKTPEEQMEAASRSLEEALGEDLLEQVLSLSPAHFERLVVELLVAMGYGGGIADMGLAIGRSGDGGIDGVVKEDKLGLDAVYVQAKRYGPENTVGRPAVQAFVGSMTGESATKGVFVTTSRFSNDARDYVRLIHQRVVLIDGQRLAQLMIEHGVGVKVDRVYKLRSIDQNFFNVDAG